MKIKCLSCSFDNEKEARFCENCKEPLLNPYIKKRKDEDQPFKHTSGEEVKTKNRIEKEKKIPNWLRWILFIPAALLALFVSYPIISVVNKIAPIGLGEGFILDIGILVLANLWSAVAFIWVGSIVAPKNNFIISIILSVIYGFMLGASFFAKLMLRENSGVSWIEMIITIITGIIAAVGVVCYFYEKEKSEDDDEISKSEIF